MNAGRFGGCSEVAEGPVLSGVMGRGRGRVLCEGQSRGPSRGW